MQIRIAFILHFVIATTLMGAFITFALASGQDTARALIIAALAGFVIAGPASWLIARRITRSARPGPATRCP